MKDKEKIRHYIATARRNGFTIRPGKVDATRYTVSSTEGSAVCFVGTARECYAFVVGYCWNRGMK